MDKNTALTADAALIVAIIALSFATGLVWWVGALIYLVINLLTFLLAKVTE